MTSQSRYSSEIAEIDEVILRLDLTLVRPDDDVTRQRGVTSPGRVTSEPGEQRADSGATDGCDKPSSSSASSSSSSSNDRSAVKTTSSSRCSQLAVNQTDELDKKKTKPLQFIRKLHRHTDTTSHQADSSTKRKSPEPLKVYTRYMLTAASILIHSRNMCSRTDMQTTPLSHPQHIHHSNYNH